MEERRKFVYGLGLKLAGKGNFLDLGVNGRTILNVILEEQHWRMWAGFIYLRAENSGGCL